MAAIPTVSFTDRIGPKTKLVIGTLALDNSYSRTTGYALTGSSFKGKSVQHISVRAGGYIDKFTRSGAVLRFYKGGPQDSVAFALTDVPGSDDVVANSDTTDQNAAPTNSAAVSAQATVSGGAWTKGTITNPTIPRTVCIVIENDSGGALDLYEGSSTFTITGTREGAAQTDTIVFTSSAGNKSVADTKFRFKYGVLPFDTVTDITLDNVPANNLKISGGLGSKLGLPADITAEANMKDVRIANAAYTFTGKVSATNQTLDCGDITADSDIVITYDRDEEEVDHGADLSGITAAPFFAIVRTAW